MVAPELALAPVTLVWVTVQLNTVPAILLVNATDVALFEQMLCEVGVAVAVGVGLTVTVTTIGVPAQPPAVGVIVYVAVPAAAPVAVNVCVIFAPELFDAPLTPDCVTVHAKVAPPVLLVSAIDVALLEHKFCELGVAVTDGAGFTVTVAVMAVPAHPPAVGVIV